MPKSPRKCAEYGKTHSGNPVIHREAISAEDRGALVPVEVIRNE
jgi:hypothetical protein